MYNIASSTDTQKLFGGFKTFGLNFRILDSFLTTNFPVNTMLIEIV